MKAATGGGILRLASASLMLPRWEKQIEAQQSQKRRRYSKHIDCRSGKGARRGCAFITKVWPPRHR